MAVVAAPLTTGAPAGAATAPLITNDGLGIRINETAVNETVLAQIEADMQPAVSAILHAGAVAHTGVANADWSMVTSDFDLALDFINAGVPGYPQGGLNLTATIDDLVISTYRESPNWWQPDCLINVDDTGPLTTDAFLKVSSAALPAAPFTPMPRTEDWSATWPTEGPAPGYPWLCSSVTAGFDWTGFSDATDPASPVSQVLDVLEAALAELTDQMWSDNVAPVVNSLSDLAGVGITFNQVRTDTNGFVTTMHVNATGGVTVAGSGPYNVSGAIDAGVTSNVNVLLAQQSTGGGAGPSDIIVSLHPNVTNQYLAAVHAHLGGAYGTTPASDALGTALVGPAPSCYLSGGWSTRLDAQAPAHLSATGASPEMQLPATTVEFLNSGCNPLAPEVATFTGAFEDIAVAAEGAPFSPPGWSSASTASWPAVRTQGDPAATSWNAAPLTLRPWARDALATFLVSVPPHIDMLPWGFPALPADPTGSGGYSGDQRITETFDIP